MSRSIGERSRSWPARFFVCVVAAVALAMGSAPSGALANPYTVTLCGPASGTSNVTFFDEFGVHILTRLCLGLTSGRGIVQQVEPENSTVLGAQRWVLTAPPGARIGLLAFNQSFTVSSFWDGGMLWVLHKGLDAGSEIIEHAEEGSMPANGEKTFVVDSESVSGRIACPNLTCKNRLALVTLANPVATLEDLSPPTVTAGGSLLAGGPIRGTKFLSFQAGDQGSGIRTALMVIDGVIEEVLNDPNGGKCVEPYQFLTPCKTALISGWTVDTSPLPDGNHLVEVSIEDASGRVTKAGAMVNIHNAPLNTARPVISGTARADEPLGVDNGKWDGNPGSFAYQWLRCPPGAKVGEDAGCVAVVGATKAGYTAAPADVGARLVARVTATNGFGSEATLSVPSDVVAARPVPPPAAPQTRLARHPRRRSAMRRARFAFGADQSGSSFECRLDRAPFRPCRSPFVRIVGRGSHSFQVRAVGPGGIADPTPVAFRWRVL